MRRTLGDKVTHSDNNSNTSKGFDAGDGVAEVTQTMNTRWFRAARCEGGPRTLVRLPVQDGLEDVLIGVGDEAVGLFNIGIGEIMQILIDTLHSLAFHVDHPRPDAAIGSF